MAVTRNTGNTARFPARAKKNKSFLIVFSVSFSLIVLIIIFLPLTRSIEDDAFIRALDKRISDLEKRLEQMDLTPDRVRQIKAHGSKVESFISNYNRLDGSIALRTKLLADRIDKLQLQLDSLRGEVVKKAKRVDRKSQKTVAKNKKNTGTYHTVKSGETFYSISRKYGLTLGHLQKLNGFTEKTIIYPGQKIRIR